MSRAPPPSSSRPPDWTAQQLKAALVSSANTDVPGDVRGRRRSARRHAAVDQPVTTTPALQGGTFDWPQHERPGHRSRAVHERLGQARHAPLSIGRCHRRRRLGRQVRRRHARQVSVTVPAGETVKVPLKLDPTAKLEAAQYGDVTGRIVATGDAKVSTPFSLYVTPETVHHGADEGSPRQPVPPVVPASTWSTSTRHGQRAFNNGAAEQTFQVRPGDLLPVELRRHPGPRADRPARLDRLLRPVRSCRSPATRPSTSTRRKAHLVSVKTDRPSEARATVLSFSRTWDDTWIHSGSFDGGHSDRRLCRRAGQRQRGHLGVR